MGGKLATNSLICGTGYISVYVHLNLPSVFDSRKCVDDDIGDDVTVYIIIRKCCILFPISDGVYYGLSSQ
jgi:hypothetical protein